VVVVVGFFLMQQITSDQLKTKELQTGNVVDNGLLQAETLSGISQRPNAGSAGSTLNFMSDLVGTLEPQSQSDTENTYAVAVVLPPEYASMVGRWGNTAGVVYAQIPTRLKAKVAEVQKKGANSTSFTFTSMNYPSGTSPAVPGLIYGVPVNGFYQLYYFFPLTQVQQSLAQIQRTLLLGGVALVFLFSAIAALVTRWVVTPVRYAALGRSGCRRATSRSGCQCAAWTSWPRWPRRSTRWRRACRRR
jgi:two-component system, OmpR family, sensor histidine kinase MtrB